MTLPKQADIIIVGAGIQGLLLATFLSEQGKSDILVLDAGYWEGGASGRNGALVRGGFSSAEWTGLFQHSVDQWKTLSRRIGYNVMYSARGCAIVAESDRTLAMLDTAAETHRTLNLQSKLLTPEELGRIAPAVAIERLRGAIFLRDGGTAPHHAAMKGALQVARSRGVQVRYGTKVTGIDRENGRASAVVVAGQRIKANLIVVAAGGQATDVANMAGVELEAVPFRIEACATEPVRPLFRPAISFVDRMTYLHQTARGEIVGGSEIAGESAKANLQSTAYSMPRYARNLVEMIPQTHNLRVLRQWSGFLHPAPDGGPLLGPHPDISDLWFSAGWTYGIAGAPGAADLMSKAITTGQVDPRMAAFSVDRFRRGKPCFEASAVIDNASAVTA